MPITLPLPSPLVSNQRSCTSLHIYAPVGGDLRGEAQFLRRVTREDGSTEDVPDGSVSFTQAELVAIASAVAFKAAFIVAARDKRASYDLLEKQKAES